MKKREPSSTGLPRVSIIVDDELFEMRLPTLRVMIAAAIKFLQDYQARTPDGQHYFTKTTRELPDPNKDDPK